ncbi:hypothetical protein, partial [Moorena sp. SIO1F2]
LYSVSYSYKVHRIFYLFPLPSYLLPAPCSLLPKAENFVPHDYDKCYSYPCQQILIKRRIRAIHEVR